MDIAGTVVKINSQTTGRDKLCRIVQYGSKFIWWYLQSKPNNEEFVKKFKHLEYSISTTRKVLRFAKSFDILLSALRTVRLDDFTLRLLVTLSKISQALYLIVDNIILLNRLKLVPIDLQSWSQLSNKYWLMMLILNLTRDINEIYVSIMREIVYEEKKNEIVGKHSGNRVKPKTHTWSQIIVKCLIENKVILLDSVKNSCDIVLPLSSLGYIAPNSGIQGLCGVVSSILGIIPVIDPMFKLIPS
ncbi:peroxisomal membrane protein 11B-like [Tubulanus polymorphus]|uniref:peroxisomal membrane protein 11B-like n=1 Tax=Tubulanus polymorphus TaxID=672921 RepID=UPI003DA66B6C